MPESQVLRQLERRVAVRILPHAGRSTLPMAPDVIPLQCRRGRHLESVTAGAAQRLVDLRQLGGRELLEFGGNVAQLRAQRCDVVELIARRWTLPGVDGPVELIGVLAQPFLAGDVAAFGRRNDALAQRIELSVEVCETPLQRISRSLALACRSHLLAQ